MRKYLPLNHNKMKYILIFLGIFLFFQVCEIYIMGGFYKQTSESKAISIIFGSIIAACISMIIFKGENEY